VERTTTIKETPSETAIDVRVPGNRFPSRSNKVAMSSFVVMIGSRKPAIVKILYGEIE
jgi:hypothetical protein